MDMAHAMTHTYDTGIAGGLGRWLERLHSRHAAHRLYRNTLSELEALNDRELGDLGLSRLVIRDVARESVYGK
jgi:uncharacterized protein YjiS (DUF1127 family)